MEPIYLETAKALKAIADPKRLRIVDMLSCGELCACRILDSFNVTQPTLSHDMRVLEEAGIVASRREGKNTFYRLNEENLTVLGGTLREIFKPAPDCICHRNEAACATPAAN